MTTVECPYCTREVTMVETDNIYEFEGLAEFKCYYCNQWFGVPMSEEKFLEIMRKKEQ